MKQAIRTALFAAAFTTLLGCAPDSGRVCDHMIEIMKNDPEKPTFLQDEDKCHDRMEKTKKRWGVNSYRREVECALSVDTAYKLRTCLETEHKRRE